MHGAGNFRWGAPRRALPLVAAAAVSVALAPDVVLVMAPLVLGVPHLVNDVRYLVLRRRLPAPLLLASAAAAATLFALRVFEVLGHAPPGSARVEALVAAAWIALCASAGQLAAPASRSDSRIHLAGLARMAPFVAVAAALAIAPPAASRAAVVLLHNVVAVALWIVVFRPPLRWAVAIVGTTALGAVALAFVGPIGGLVILGSRLLLDPSLLATAAALAPGLSPARALGVLQAVAFLQLVHYATWLAWIPAASRRSALGDVAAHRGELAIAGSIAAVPLVAALLLVGAAEPRAARDAYLSFATFHAYLEIAVWAFLATRGRAAGEVRDAAPLAAAAGT